MPLKMKELPISERPYEKLKMYGAEKLSNAELLAIVIKSGTKEENSVDIANRIILLTEKLEDIDSLSIQDLMKIKGIGEIKAIIIKAVFELTKRLKKTSNTDIIIKSPKDVADLFINEYRFEKQEIVKEIILNNKNKILKIIDLVKGDTNFANITTKQILMEPVKMQAQKIIIIHNHPSGDTIPSKSDIKITNSLKYCCKIFGIELLDHIIIGNNSYESIFAFLKREGIKNGNMEF